MNLYKIGKSRSCDIVLADSTVSGHHADILFLPKGKILLTDAGSKNGTYLLKDKEFKKIQKAYISPTDVLRFGVCEMAVKDLLEFLHLKSGPSDPASSGKDKKRVEGKKLTRCICGAIKKQGQICPVCSQETRGYNG
ncbi:MAG: FHA domain-containing protein [Desulfobacterales bacterium]|nr:FHA domain-containing protein [Desulfobacterales bacterium]